MRSRFINLFLLLLAWKKGRFGQFVAISLKNNVLGLARFYNKSGREFSSIYRACDSKNQKAQVFICYQTKKAVENDMPDRDSKDIRDLLKKRTRHTENKSQYSMNMIKTGGKFAR